MSDTRTAPGMDRLPWLTDEPKKVRPTNRAAGGLVPWAVAAMLVIAGASFWVGSLSETPQSEQPSTARTSATVSLPASRPAPSQEVAIAPPPQVTQAPPPEVRPAPVREVRIAPPPVKKLATSEAATQPSTEETAAETPQPTETKIETAARAAPPAHSAPLKPWQPRVVAGAAGRLVEIGAFGSVPQAKDGWRYMVRTYPAVAHLPAVVRPDKNSKGRTYYRFRIGTTSQAHSEVLCQRMQKIQFSCAVVGLPWKEKVER
jgi:outer membrane biosynthesis protein TonB